MLQLPGTGPLILPVGSELTGNNALGLRGSVIATMEAFNTEFGVSKAANGYQKLPSGLILQWGQFTWVRTTLGTMTVNFPMTFPTAVLQVALTDSGTGTGATGGQSWRIDLTTTSLFGAFSGESNPSVLVGQSQFFAIGY